MSSNLLVTSHSRLLIPAFKLGFPISRIVIESAAEGLSYTAVSIT